VVITLLMQIAMSVVIPNRLIFAPLAAADKALYDGRSAGRNRVVMAESH
jgi:PleD family two-component response regulator